MADWWRRLLYPELFDGDPIAGEMLSPSARQAAELAGELATLDPWDVPMVVATRQLAADTAAMMPMVAMAGRDRLDPIPPILRRPDPTEPYRVTIERIVNAMTRHGRAWLEVDIIGHNNKPIAAHIVDESRVSPTVDPVTRRLTSVLVDGRSVALERIVHIPMRVDRDPLGESPLQAIRPALAQLVEVYRYSSAYYTTAEVPPYAVVHPNRLTVKQSALYSDQWLLARAERRPPILSGGITLQTYNRPSAADSMLLDAINNLDAAVARVMMTPPSLVNAVAHSSLTYSTTVAELDRWLNLGLYPMFLSRIESAFSDLLPRGQTAIFDTSNLTRMDFPGRIETYAASIAAGIHTTAEVRALEGLPADLNAVPDPIQANVGGL
jgi:phage portal protein BeeE